MRTGILVSLALAIIAVVVSPSLAAGFYADDWFVGAQVAMTADADLLDRFVTPPWASEFQILRPLGLWATGQDLQRNDPPTTHLISLLLWLTAAAMVGTLCGRWLEPASLTAPLGALVFGIWPASVEALGWTAARPDLMVLISSLAALLLLNSRAPRGGLIAGCVLVALASKETAVLLPPILLWIDRMAPWSEGGALHRQPRHSFLKRHAPSFGVLALYLLARASLFGSIGGRYQGRPYLDAGDGLGALIEDLGGSLLRLAAPVNEAAAIAEDVPISLLLVPMLGLTTTATLATLRQTPRLVVAALPMLVLPILLMVVPLDGVGTGLERSRMLALPQVAWTLVVVAAFRHFVVVRKWGRACALAGICIVFIGACGWSLALRPYVEAARISDQVLSTLTDTASPGEKIVLLGTEDPSGESDVHPSLREHHGCHLFSSAIDWAGRPPFQAGRGVDIERVSPEAAGRIETWRAPPAGLRIFRFDPRSADRRFRRLAPRTGRHPWPHGKLSLVTPASGSSIPSDWRGPFIVQGTGGEEHELRIRISEPSGHEAISSLRRPRRLAGETWVARFDLADFTFLRQGITPEGQLSAAAFGALESGLFLWWVESVESAEVVRRITDVAIVTVDRP